jgi:large subunit ribosomal protein L23
MRSPYDIIVKPYVTEKSNGEVAFGKYTFVVDKKATKTEIKSAVEKLFTVKVVAVSTLNYNGKKKRMGVHQGYRADWKKAVVKIDTDPKAEVYLEKGANVTTVQRKYKTSIEEFGATQ